MLAVVSITIRVQHHARTPLTQSLTAPPPIAALWRLASRGPDAMLGQDVSPFRQSRPLSALVAPADAVADRCLFAAVPGGSDARLPGACRLSARVVGAHHVC